MEGPGGAGFVESQCFKVSGLFRCQSGRRACVNANLLHIVIL
jgi:hypothetical protein